MDYPQYIINPDTLREELLDVEYTMKWCLQNKQNSEVVSYLRMLGKLSEAEETGLRFVNEIVEISRLMTAKLRLACVYHWKHDFVEAESLFDSVILECEADENYIILGFTLQHKAKMLIDMQRISDAKAYAIAAYKIRKKYDFARVASTKLVLDYLEKAE